MLISCCFIPRTQQSTCLTYKTQTLCEREDIQWEVCLFVYIPFQADYYTCTATIVYLRKENCLYQACPSQDCNKKVVDQQNGMYRCEKCDKEFPNFKYRLILSVSQNSARPKTSDFFMCHTTIYANTHVFTGCSSCFVPSRCFCKSLVAFLLLSFSVLDFT